MSILTSKVTTNPPPPKKKRKKEKHKQTKNPKNQTKPKNKTNKYKQTNNTVGILTKALCTSGPNLVILEWTGYELLCGQAQNGQNIKQNKQNKQKQLKISVAASRYTHWALDKIDITWRI